MLGLVAQRVLEMENHVLLVGGKTYPLTVTAHAAELSPDEVTSGIRRARPQQPPPAVYTPPRALPLPGTDTQRGDSAHPVNLN